MSPGEIARYNEHWVNVAENISNESLDNQIAFIKSGGIPRTGGAWQVVTDGGKYSNAIRRQPMKKELELLCNYLKKNGYEDDSKRVEEIMHDITKADSENAKKTSNSNV